MFSDRSIVPYEKQGKKRGSYNCGRCGQPKKGHNCSLSSEIGLKELTEQHTDINRSSISSFGRSHIPLRRTLYFGDDAAARSTMTVSKESEIIKSNSPLPWSCLVEVLQRLPPSGLLMAAQVCTGWRDCVRRLWRATEELRLRVTRRSHLGFAASVLQKCPGLARLMLIVESDLDATILACIAFSCPNIESLEIQTADTALNRITGDELGRFVAERRCLLSLKIEGCTNLGLLNIYSTSLSTLWLSDLHSISKTVINCPKLRELSLDFSRQENDFTNLVVVVDNFVRACPRLKNIHVASVKLDHEVTLSLADARLRDLRMLSLVLGSGIDDASVAALVSSYANLELLDLSGSSVSDSGISMICNVYSESLCRLSLALCPNITSSGVQFATAQLPLLQILDCGMSMGDSVERSCRNNEPYRERAYAKKYSMYQKLIIKHDRLKKLSLWGCSGLDAVYLNCSQLYDVNLNLCSNLHPERLLLQCPNLVNVYAVGCGDVLIRAIKSQVFDKSSGSEQYLFKRSADGSKRIRVPDFLCQEVPEYDKGPKIKKERCLIHVV